MSKRRHSYFLHPSSPGSASDNENPEPPGSVAGAKSGISRRVFLARGSLVAGTAAVVGSVPGLSSLLSSAETDSTEMSGAAGAAEAGAVGSEAGPALSEPLVLHVVNTSTGELNLYQGTEQFVTRNPGLAQAIARLAASKG